MKINIENMDLLELKNEIIKNLKNNENYKYCENNIDIILNNIINYIESIDLNDNIILNLNPSYYNFNDDFKNSPFLSFYINQLEINIDDNNIIIDENIYLNISDDFKIKNIIKV